MKVGVIANAIWLALFGILLTFVMGVIVWALAGPTMSLIIFAVALILFVWLPWKTRKSPPHH